MTIEVHKANGHGPREITRTAQLEPQNFAEVARLAEYVAKSGLFAVKTQEQAMLVMLTGASLGLSPVAALRGVHVIQGKAALDATLVTALVQQHPDCEYWRLVENTNDRCTIETKRRGHPEPVTRTWTIDDAKRANLTGKDTWKSYPAAMLRARCTTDLARGVYGDALFGVYTPEELEPAPRDVNAAVTYAVREHDRRAETATVTVVEKPAPSADALTDLLSRIASAATIDELSALSKEGGKLTAKGTPERERVTAALHARRAEIEGGKPPTGGGSPKPTTTHDAATGEVITGEHVEAPKAWTADAWKAHVGSKANRYEVANSFARHEGELDAAGVTDAADIAIERLIALGLDESHAVEAIASAVDRKSRKAAA